MVVATFEEETGLKEGKTTRMKVHTHKVFKLPVPAQLVSSGKTKIKLLSFVGIKSLSGPSDPSRGSRVTTKRCSTALVRVRFGLMHAWH